MNGCDAVVTVHALRAHTRVRIDFKILVEMIMEGGICMLIAIDSFGGGVVNICVSFIVSP